MCVYPDFVLVFAPKPLGNRCKKSLSCVSLTLNFLCAMSTFYFCTFFLFYTPATAAATATATAIAAGKLPSAVWLRELSCFLRYFFLVNCMPKLSSCPSQQTVLLLLLLLFVWQQVLLKLNCTFERIHLNLNANRIMEVTFVRRHQQQLH